MLTNSIRNKFKFKTNTILKNVLYSEINSATNKYISYIISEWHRCQTPASKRNTIDFGIFPLPAKELSIAAIRWKANEVAQITVSPAPILGKLFLHNTN